MHFSPVIGVLALSLLTVVPYNGVQGFDLRSLRGRFVGSGPSLAAAHVSTIEGALKKRDTSYERDLPILNARHDHAAKNSTATKKDHGKKKGGAAGAAGAGTAASNSTVTTASNSTSSGAMNPDAGTVTTLNGGGDTTSAAAASSSSATTTRNGNGKHKGKTNQNSNVRQGQGNTASGNTAGGDSLASLIGSLEGGLGRRDIVHDDVLPVAALPVK